MSSTSREDGIDGSRDHQGIVQLAPPTNRTNVQTPQVDSNAGSREVPTDDSLPARPDDVDARELACVREAVTRRLLGTETESAKIGRFSVLRRIGQGGMGVVYSVFDERLDRRVALKLIKPGAEAAWRARFHREARAMAKLSHPNVVPVFEVGEHAGELYLVMEYVRGMTLRRWAKEHDPSTAEIVDNYVQAARGLAAAHAAGIVHRDFKPDNAIVGESGRVRVLDFGLAQRQGGVSEDCTDATDAPAEADSLDTALTEKGSIIGTPGYMSPEQLRGRPTDHRSDQFAFCVALWEAMCGERPFRGRTTLELVTNVTSGRVRPPPRNAKLPGWMRPILERGLNADPAARWPSMDALLGQLGRDPARRRRAWLAAGAGVLVVLGAVAWQQAERARTIVACEREGEAIAAAWNDAKATTVAAAFEGTGISYAAETWSAAAPVLAAWSGAWSSVRTQVCIEGEVEGTRSPEELASARECLADQRSRLIAMLDQLERPDAAVVRKAVASVRSLPDPATCGDQRVLAARPRLPDDPILAADLRALRSDLSRVLGLHATARLSEAQELAEAVVARADALGFTPLVAESYRALGSVLRDLGKYHEARRALEKAWYAAGASAQDRIAMSAATALVQVVGVRLADTEEGLRWVEVARMFVARQELPPDHPDLGIVLADEGALHLTRGAYDEALAAFESALAIQRASLGDDHPEVASSIDSLGMAHLKRGDAGEALRTFQRSLAIRRAALGPGHPDVALSLNNIGVVHRHRGELAEALTAQEEALKIRLETLGDEHVEVAGTLVNIGTVRAEMGLHTASLEALEQGLAILRKTVGPDHPNVGAALLGVARNHHARGEYDGALAAYEEALRIARYRGAEHPDVAMALNGIANAQQARGAHDEAREAQEEGLAIWERVHGPEHPLVALALANLGVAYRAAGEYEAAIVAQGRALAIREKVLGPEHQDVGASLVNLAIIHQNIGERARALEFLARARAIFERGLGSDHPLLATCLQNIGSVHEDEGDHEAARAAYAQAVAIRERGDVSRGELATARFGLARAAWASGHDREGAIALAEEARAAYAELGDTAREDLDAAVLWLEERAPRRREASRGGDD